MCDTEKAIAIYDAKEDKYDILCPHCLTWLYEPNRKYKHPVRFCPLCLDYFEVDYGVE